MSRNPIQIFKLIYRLVGVRSDLLDVGKEDIITYIIYTLLDQLQLLVKIGISQN